MRPLRKLLQMECRDEKRPRDHGRRNARGRRRPRRACWCVAGRNGSVQQRQIGEVAAARAQAPEHPDEPVVAEQLVGLADGDAGEELGVGHHRAAQRRLGLRGVRIAGDPGAESVFHWTAQRKNIDRRGAGPMDASIFGRGAGEGFGVHVCTGPVLVHDAEPGDVLEVRILDTVIRPSANPDYAGKAFGSNFALGANVQAPAASNCQPWNGQRS